MAFSLAPSCHEQLSSLRGKQITSLSIRWRSSERRTRRPDAEVMPWLLRGFGMPQRLLEHLDGIVMQRNYFGFIAFIKDAILGRKLQKVPLMGPLPNRINENSLRMITNDNKIGNSPVRSMLIRSE
ncbi:hypothetical protein [Paenibacillus algicola]|uniref:hypothetical protein n=1 Tax=Paenibacillus algicola TaxID=2565926 RepID=UPI0010FEC129|nr:hypothetical protein [Paenibacillus algicola]